MKISIIGTGEVGTYYADHWSKAGHELVLTLLRYHKRLWRKLTLFCSVPVLSIWKMQLNKLVI